MKERIPQIPPRIEPIQSNDRPLWSVMIPTYNCYSYLQLAIESVLQQDPGESKMQIEVIDDCSTDGDVQALVERVGKGRVAYYRQPCNQGSLRNFETCINRARGEYVQLLHGDDRVRPGFYKAIKELLELEPGVGAAFCNSLYIDAKGVVTEKQNLLKPEKGILKNALVLLGEGQKIETPSIVVKRAVYEDLGAFRAVIYGEDWDMWIRIAHKYKIAFTPEYLAEYRQHFTSISAEKLAHADNIKDLEKVIHLTREYFPPDIRKKVNNMARYNYAWFAIVTAKRFLFHHRNPMAAKAQLKAAVRLHQSPGILLESAKLYFKVLSNAR